VETGNIRWNRRWFQPGQEKEKGRMAQEKVGGKSGSAFVFRRFMSLMFVRDYNDKWKFDAI
jgi:hypothetical protein